MLNSDQKSDGPILHIEDNDADFEAVTHLFEKGGVTMPISRCKDGDEALDYLFQRKVYFSQAPRPSLVILDLNLPGISGHSVLAAMKSDEALRTIPVLILSSSAHQPDIDASYKAGANSYFMKPDTLLEFANVIDIIKRYWLGKYIARESGKAMII